MDINPEFELGQGVYLRTDPEQDMRIVTRYIVSVSEITYEVTSGVMAITCQGIELSENKDLVNFI